MNFKMYFKYIFIIQIQCQIKYRLSIQGREACLQCILVHISQKPERVGLR